MAGNRTHAAATTSYAAAAAAGGARRRGSAARVRRRGRGGPRAPAASSASLARVAFTSRCETEYGESLVLVGSAPALGSWSVDEGVRMRWSGDGAWACECLLPCGAAVDLKLVRTDGRAREEWIGGHAGAEAEAAPGRGNMTVIVRLGREGAEPSKITGGQGDRLLSVADVGLVADAAHGGAGGSPAGLAPAADAAANGGAIDFAAAAARAGMPMTVTHTTTTTVTVGAGAGAGAGGAAAHDDVVIDVPGGALPGAGEPAPGAVAEALMANEGLPRFYRARFAWPHAAASVGLKGSWDGWAREVAMIPRGARGPFEVELVLPADEFTAERIEYEYKFIVDGEWRCDDALPSRGGNNLLTLSGGGDVVVYAFPSARRLLPQARAGAGAGAGAGAATIEIDV